MLNNPASADQTSLTPSVPSFAQYVDELGSLLGDPQSQSRTDGLIAALDGEASRRLRASVPLDHRRRDGAFFTGQALSKRLLANDKRLIRASATIADPACGAGDLLLPVAQMLPIAGTVPSTLRQWGKLLIGRDVNPLHVRLARLRLALLASARVGRRWGGNEEDLAELLNGIAVGDGTSLEIAQPNTFVVLNPPFGAVVATEPWGCGRLARAGVFTARIAEQLPHGATLRAVLPDVLRSGSNYRRWRSHIEQLLSITRVESVGQFDPWTDVDVFILGGKASSAGSSATWWPTLSTVPQCATINDQFEVRVGPVVPHRDPISGDESPYLRARDLPLNREYHPGKVRLRHNGRRFTPPLVVVRRTSRPERTRSRITATLIRGREPVLVENHLLVCTPRDGKLESCNRLLESLSDKRTSEWLDERLRCRHLTVTALRDTPLHSWTD